jgi:deoxyribodipyrimidine photo-lyase
MPTERILLYIHRRDVRLSDNPLYHRISNIFAFSDQYRPDSPDSEREDSVISDNENERFTHLLPIYVFPANQVETSGFLSADHANSPYPEARSRVAKVWRTGPHRANFLAEGAWDLKKRLEGLECGTGLEIRVGMVEDVVKHILDFYSDLNLENGVRKAEVAAIWMTNEEGPEEKDDEVAIQRLALRQDVDFKVWSDEKYYIDE